MSTDVRAKRLLHYSKKRLQAFLDQIHHLQGLEFPYEHSALALEQLRITIRDHLVYLNSLTAASDFVTVRAASTSAVAWLFIYLPLVGFIVRSTDVRNAFEIYGPLLKLARGILGPSTNLILSSEWDYSPFTYQNVPELKDFVLIGLPAPESDNPLLVPLAGHELGHPVWQSRGLVNRVSSKIETTIVTEIKGNRWRRFSKLFPEVKKVDLTVGLAARQTWQPAYEWALLQAEETFCDMFGLRLFAESYLHSFAYLLAPNQGGQRPVAYPNMRRRVEQLVQAAKKYRIPAPKDYVDLFEDLAEPQSDDKSKLWLILADVALLSVLQDLIGLGGQVADQAQIPKRNSKKINEIYDAFRKHVVPAKNPGALLDILNAGWKASLNSSLWRGYPQAGLTDRTLRELVLKSIEVLEFKQIVEAP